MPKLDFPAFTGERLKSWKHECESYFRVFRVPPENWVDTATMHFTGNAQLWIENSDLNLTQISWGSLCAVVCDQFGRDEFQKLLRQLFHLKQRGTVAEYVQDFMEMMHALRVHSTAWDPKLFPSRFVDGLKDQIRVVVLVHQPTDLDDAISLALLQEEAWEIWKQREPREPRRYEPTPRSPPCLRLSSIQVRLRLLRTATIRSAEDKRGQEAARELPQVKIDNRATTLKSYR
jgi:hypothetical protein